jgi:hypothetical protein
MGQTNLRSCKCISGYENMKLMAGYGQTVAESIKKNLIRRILFWRRYRLQ